MVQRRQLSWYYISKRKGSFPSKWKDSFQKYLSGSQQIEKEMKNYWKISIIKFKYVPKILREYAKENKTTIATTKTQKGK